MTIQIHLHKTHRQFTNGQETIEVNGKNVGECLKELIRQYPPLEKEIFAKGGKLSPINGKSAFPNELSKPVKDGDVIHLVYFLAGG